MNEAKKTYNRENVRQWRIRQRKVTIDLLGGVCAICGFDDQRALQFDHVKGGGVKDINNTPNYRTHVLKSVMANEGKFQLLCANCNWIKRADNGEVRNGQITN